LSKYLIRGYALNEKKLKEQNEKLKELKDTVKMLGEITNIKSLTNDESIGLLRIISDYAYALDVLDQYDYQSLAINNTTLK